MKRSCRGVSRQFNRQHHRHTKPHLRQHHQPKPHGLSKSGRIVNR
jgi:hypothetical protein